MERVERMGIRNISGLTSVERCEGNFENDIFKFNQGGESCKMILHVDVTRV